MKKLSILITLMLLIGIGIVTWLYATPSEKSTLEKNQNSAPTPVESSEHRPEHTPQGCSSAQPCEELQLPPSIANKPAIAVSNTKGDFSALNLGYEVDLSWTNQPPSAMRIVLYRAS